MILACICGGWIELMFISGGVIFAAVWRFLKKICFASGCKCECHDLQYDNEVNRNTQEEFSDILHETNKGEK